MKSSEFVKYERLKQQGFSPMQIIQAARRDGLDEMTITRMLRALGVPAGDVGNVKCIAGKTEAMELVDEFFKELAKVHERQK